MCAAVSLRVQLADSRARMFPPEETATVVEMNLKAAKILQSAVKSYRFF